MEPLLFAVGVTGSAAGRPPGHCRGMVRRAVRGGLKRDRRAGADLAGQTRTVLVAAIRLYQQEVSPRRAPPCCRYMPTCSTYALQALDTHGLGGRLWLAAGRLLRCRPGSAGGIDWIPAV